MDRFRSHLKHYCRFKYCMYSTKRILRVCFYLTLMVGLNSLAILIILVSSIILQLRGKGANSAWLFLYQSKKEALVKSKVGLVFKGGITNLNIMASHQSCMNSKFNTEGFKNGKKENKTLDYKRLFRRVNTGNVENCGDTTMT